MAFKNEIATFFKTINYLNVISVGDAEYEYNALISLFDWKAHHAKKLLKSIK